MKELHRCLVCDDTLNFEILSAKKIFYGCVVTRKCPLGHITVEHRERKPYERV